MWCGDWMWWVGSSMSATIPTKFFELHREIFKVDKSGQTWWCKEGVNMNELVVSGGNWGTRLCKNLFLFLLYRKYRKYSLLAKLYNSNYRLQGDSWLKYISFNMLEIKQNNKSTTWDSSINEGSVMFYYRARFTLFKQNNIQSWASYL